MNGRDDGLRWLWIGLSGMFILIGVAAVIAVLLFGDKIVLTPGNFTTQSFNPWNWIWNLIGLFIFLWVLFFVIRVFIRPWRWHRYYDFWAHGDATDILRERYARGEITKEQFESMMDDLKRNRKE